MAFYYISKRYSQVSNRYLKSYDPNQESKRTIYLYGYAMSTVVPTVRFKWVDLTEFDSNIYNSNCSKGSILKVDFEHPKELHKLHNDYHLAPDRIEIKEKILSCYQVPKSLSMSFIMRTCNFRLELKVKELLIRIESTTMAKPIY